MNVIMNHTILLFKLLFFSITVHSEIIINSNHSVIKVEIHRKILITYFIKFEAGGHYK